eukprot:7041466-Pyramimonas_sp.AAC.1
MRRLSGSRGALAEEAEQEDWRLTNLMTKATPKGVVSPRRVSVGKTPAPNRGSPAPRRGSPAPVATLRDAQRACDPALWAR